MPELSEATKKLIAQYSLANQQESSVLESETIHVDEVALRVAAFYEQIRTVVEWKEEHLMRRAAIIRKLKRKFFDLELNGFITQNETGESLILELIRGGHLPNDRIQESKIEETQNIINRYVFFLKNSPEYKEGKTGLDFYNWLLEVAACEIEDTLIPAIEERALMDFMFTLMKEKIKVSEKIYEAKILKKDRTDLQIYIAVQQSLFKLDKPIISYNLLSYKYPNWKKNDEQFLSGISQAIFKIWKDIENDLSNPLANKFYIICEKYDTPYLLLGDILLQENIIQNKDIEKPAKLELLIKKAYSKRLSTLKTRTKRAAIYSTISIFVTKILSLFLLLVLLSKLVPKESQSAIMLIVDVLVPTLLMFIMISLIKNPSEKNLNIVVMETMKIVYKEETPDIYEIKMKTKKGFLTRMIISLVYVISSFASFGAIYFAFAFFNFPISSIVINMIFIALILFTGTTLSKRAQELTIEEEKENFLSFIADIFFLPVQGLGKWISTKWKKYNAVAAIFNALIDMPFSVFIEFLEKWRYFIKEKKEEMR
jgi:hypothetical protein